MKVSVDVDCTPEEARRLLGLPDLSEVHSDYVEKMKAALAEGAVADMMKAWAPTSETAMAMWRQLLEQMAKGRS